MILNKELIDIIVCPACRSGVVEENGKVICRSCGREYPVINGIPVMLADEAEKDHGRQSTVHGD